MSHLQRPHGHSPSYVGQGTQQPNQPTNYQPYSRTPGTPSGYGQGYPSQGQHPYQGRVQQRPYPVQPSSNSHFYASQHGYARQASRQQRAYPQSSPPSGQYVQRSPHVQGYAQNGYPIAQPPSRAFQTGVPLGRASVPQRQNPPSSVQPTRVTQVQQRPAQPEEEQVSGSHARYLGEMLLEATLVVIVILVALVGTYYALYHLGWGDIMRDNGFDYLHQWFG